MRPYDIITVFPVRGWKWKRTACVPGNSDGLSINIEHRVTTYPVENIPITVRKIEPRKRGKKQNTHTKKKKFLKDQPVQRERIILSFVYLPFLET